MKGKFNWRSFMAVPFLLGLFFIAGLSSVKAVTLFGVTTNNQLISFDSATPGTTSSTVAITGLGPGETILGIDFRPATGQLYALGSNSRLFTINLTTGAATQVGSSGAFRLDPATGFGFDFNPVTDRIRVVSASGQNLQLDPNTGALSAEDPGLNPRMPNVTGAAYSNNVAGATSTVLYVIDTFDDTLNQQNPATGVIIPIGFLGVDASDINGFDIGSGNQAFAALTVTPGGSGLYSINLTTGAATRIGNIGNGSTSLTGLSILISGPTPPPTPTPTVTPTPRRQRAVLDFNRDGKTDFVVFRPSINTFFIALDPNNANRNFRGVQFGLASTDIITPGDYDGDGRDDVAVFRTTTGTFFVLRSSDNALQAFQFGQNGDQPVPRDYDGDGKTDFAVVRKVGANLVWFINNSSNNSFRAEQFGLATDTVAPGDYDGDGKFDLGVFRGSGADRTGPATFFVLRSSDRGLTAVQFGLGSDLVVPGDYDGDGRSDFAVVRQGSPFTFFILNSSNNSFRAVEFGRKPFLPTPGDYDGDGRTDIAVFDPTTGNFFVLRSTDNRVSVVQFGQNGDVPVATLDVR